MNDDPFTYRRKSHMELGQLYFWTATINQWQKLFLDDRFKQVIIDSLTYLSSRKKLDVFAFVIMPNHVHFIWRMLEDNGKETTAGSFLKYTAHAFKKLLNQYNPSALTHYKVKTHNKSHEFWQRDSLAVHLYSREVAYQKLDYIHANPVAQHWQLAVDPCDYKYSSARYYELGQYDFSFIKDLRDEF